MAPRRSSHWATSRQPRSKAWYIGVQPNIILSADVLGSANYEEKLGYTNVTVKAGAMNGIRIKMKYASAEPTNFLRHGVICDAALPAIWSGSITYNLPFSIYARLPAMRPGSITSKSLLSRVLSKCEAAWVDRRSHLTATFQSLSVYLRCGLGRSQLI